MKEVKLIRMIHKESQNRNCAYTIFKLPWPFDDKDLVTSYKSVILDSDHYRIQVRSVENVIQEFPNIDRIKGYQATWEMTRIKENKTMIVYTVVSDIQPIVPRFIQDPIVLKVCIQDFAMLKQLLSQ